MKKRFVALLLCLVMLVTCMGVGLDVISGDAPAATVEPTAEPSAEPVSEPSAEPSAEPAPDSDLYAQLMACKTQAEMNAIVEEFGEEQITAQLTEEQLIAINEYYSSLAEGSSETEQEQDSSSYTPAVNFTNVAPLLDPVKGAASRKAARAAANSDSNTDKGMKFDKTATDNGDGTYTIQLEAYATGSKVISEITKDVPTDIVLVLDQSGSMDYCIECGKAQSSCGGHYNYVPTYDVEQKDKDSSDYYIFNGSEYIRVAYCNGSRHWLNGNKHTASWVPASLSWDGNAHNSYFDNGNPVISPKSSADGEGTQFYLQTTKKAFTSRKQALVSAVTTFTDAVAAKAAGKDGNINTTADNINHRIAIVGFASESGNGNNTELLSISGTNSGSVGIRYSDIQTQDYKDVLQSMDTASGKAMVSNAINALAAEGATRTDLGMDMAERILNANPVKAGEQRNRVVIVFTDGSPTASNGFEKATANSAISTASDIKKAGTTVYSIGVFSGADASSAGTEPSYDLGKNSNQLTSASNWFMQKLSSNNGQVQSPSYYLSAGDSASLNNIFKQISDQIESGEASTTLDSKTVIKDVVSEAFKLPEGATANDITLETYKYDGPGKWTKNSDAMGAKATVDAATGEVSVTGFDFKANYVTDIKDGNGNLTGEHRGNKLVIKFKVKAKDGFLGGNGVYTNDNAGIYGDETAKNPTFTFDRPTVDVKIKDVAVTALDKNVYLKSGLTAEQLKSDSTVKVGNVVLNLNADNYGLEAWQNEYVNITVTIKDKDGNEVTGLDKLSDDQTYSLTVTVSPKTGTGAKADTATAKINVFVPELTYQDSAIDLGQTPDYAKENLVSEKWKHDSTYSTAVTMTGTKPELDLSYDPAEKAFTEDTPVKVTVKINGENVTDKVAFLHNTCDYDGCNFADVNCHFIVHIKTFDLTITKNITSDESSLYGERNFVFTITAEDGTEIQAVVNVEAGEKTGSTTIKGLPVGTYTITEDTVWSWRYDLKGVAAATDVKGTLEYTSGSASAKYTPSDGTHNEVVFTNSLTNYHWLSFVDSVRNFFNAK